MKSYYRTKLYKIFFLMLVTLLYTILFSLSANVLRELGILSIKKDDILSTENLIIYTGSAFILLELAENIEYRWFRNCKLFMSVLIGFLFGIAANLFSYFYSFFPLLFDYPAIGPGKLQSSVIYEALSLEHFLVTSSISVLFEEIIFRVFLFYFIGELIKVIYNLLKKDTTKINIYDLTTKEGIFTLICTSLLFAIVHGFSLITVPIYLIPGLIFGYLYCKLGLFSSIVAHSASNYFTHIIRDIVLRLFC